MSTVANRTDRRRDIRTVFTFFKVHTVHVVSGVIDFIGNGISTMDGDVRTRCSVGLDQNERTILLDTPFSQKCLCSNSKELGKINEFTINIT